MCFNYKNFFIKNRLCQVNPEPNYSIHQPAHKKTNTKSTSKAASNITEQQFNNEIVEKIQREL